MRLNEIEKNPSTILQGLKTKDPESIEFAQSLGIPPAVIDKFVEMELKVDQTSDERIRSYAQKLENILVGYIEKAKAKPVSRRSFLKGTRNFAAFISNLDSILSLLKNLPQTQASKEPEIEYVSNYPFTLKMMKTTWKPRTRGLGGPYLRYEGEFNEYWPGVIKEFTQWYNSLGIPHPAGGIDEEELKKLIFHPVIEDNYFKAMSYRGEFDEDFAEFVSEVLTDSNIIHEREGRTIKVGTWEDWFTELSTSDYKKLR